MPADYFVTNEPGYEANVFSEIYKAGYGQKLVEIRTGDKINFTLQDSNGKLDKMTIQFYLNYNDLKISDEYKPHIYCIREALSKQFHKKPKKIDKNVVENKLKKYKKPDPKQLNCMSAFLGKDVSANMTPIDVLRRCLTEQEKYRISKLKVPEKKLHNPSANKFQLKLLDVSMSTKRIWKPQKIEKKSEEEKKVIEIKDDEEDQNEIDDNDDDIEFEEEVEEKTYVNEIYYAANIDFDSMKNPNTVSKILRHKPKLPEKGYEYTREDKTLCHIAHICGYMYIFCSEPISADEINQELDKGYLYEIKNSSFTAVLMMNFFLRKEILMLELKGLESMISKCHIIYTSNASDSKAITIGFQWKREDGIYSLRAFDRDGKLNFPKDGEKKEYTILTPSNYINKKMCSIISFIIDKIKD